MGAEKLEKTFYTETEYFELEAKSEIKHEFHNGEIFAMSGGTNRHSGIAAKTIGSLLSSLRSKNCEVFTSDLRVFARKINNYYHPDCTVVCGDFQVNDNSSEENPKVIIEVLSESTESYDRGAKFHAYQTIDSLQEYVLISQHKPMIEVFTRNENGFWLLRSAVGMESSITLHSLAIELPLADIFRNVAFDEEL